MKFKFCADGDCPLWALAALHALSSLPAQLFRALLHKAYEEDDEDGIMELLKDTSLGSRAECARALAGVRWAVGAWCGGGGEAGGAGGAGAAARELAALGVPRAHAAALGAAAERQRARRRSVAARGFGVNKVTDVSVSAAPEGASDAIKLTLYAETAGEQNRTELLIEKTQAKDLLEQLKVAYKKMEEIDGNRD